MPKSQINANAKQICTRYEFFRDSSIEESRPSGKTDGMQNDGLPYGHADSGVSWACICTGCGELPRGDAGFLHGRHANP